MRPAKPSAGDKKTKVDSELRPALKPKRWLFILLMAVFAGWIATLITMFVLTVYPHPELDVHRRTPATTEMLAK